MNPTAPMAKRSSRVMQSSLAQWLLVEIFFCLHVVTLTAYAIGAPGFQQRLDLSSVQMGTLAAAFFAAYGLSQLLVGSQLGRWPNRWLIGGSAGMATIGALLLLGSDHYTTALLARLLMGAGVGMTLVSTVHVVSERYSTRFALMTNISQGLANSCGAAIGVAIPLLPALKDIRISYQAGFLLLLLDTVLILVFCRDAAQASSTARGAEADPPQPPRRLSQRLRSILGMGGFWCSLAFFGGLFGSFLSFAEVWNIQFQVDVFHRSADLAPLINTTVILGLAIGSIASGVIAERVGFVKPARMGAALTLAMLLILRMEVLPLWVAVVAQSLLGLGMGTAALGLSALRDCVPGDDFPLASSVMLTGVFLSAGLLSAAVGSTVTTLHSAPTDFSHYQQALSWFIAFAAVACTASFTMREQH